MGPFTEAQQLEMVSSLRQTARDTLVQLKKVIKLTAFGLNDESLRALDQFALEYRTQGIVSDHNTKGYTFGVGTLLGDLLIEKYGGKWVIDKHYTIATRSAKGATAYLFPFTPVAARLKGNAGVSIHRYFFTAAPITLGFTAPLDGLSGDEAMLARIKNLAAAVINMLPPSGPEGQYGLTAHSVAVLDDYLERNVKTSSPKETKEKFMNLVGSFLGECIISEYGAKWNVLQNQPSLSLQTAGTTHFLNPFAKVAKRIENGSEDNISFYFSEFIPTVMKASS
jgi:hypothetical protein